MSNFNYCPLLWMFSSARSLKRIENLLKRALQVFLQDYVSTYEHLLDKADRRSVK